MNNSNARNAGWSAVNNARSARRAYDAWTRGDKLELRTLALARDYAVLHKTRRIVDAINGDLRRATMQLMK